MDRRQFLQFSALSALATSFGAQAEGAKLRYILASAMYGEMPLVTILQEMKKLGVTEIDLWPRKWGSQREQVEEMGHDAFAELLEKHGAKLGCITRYDLGPLGMDGELGLAHKLGAKILVSGGKGNAKLQGVELKAEVKKFVDHLRPYAEKAAEQGITIAIENHINNVIDTPDSLRWLADMETAGMGIAFAPYHLPQDNEVLASLIRHIGPRLTLFYAWEHGMGNSKPMPKDEELQQLPGRGRLDFKPMIQALKGIKFVGPVEIFMHPTPRGLPIMPKAEEVTAEINRPGLI